MKFSPTPLTINQLFTANEQYVIPTYQRRYSWTEKQIWELIDDIAQIESGDQHLLGMVVCLTSDHMAGVNQLELVDGQQRLTTLVILLSCIQQRFTREGLEQEAREVEALLISKRLSGKSFPKVLLDSIDASEFADLVAQAENKEYKNRQLVEAFRIIRDDAVGEVSVEELRGFVYRLKNQAVIIRLDVSQARDAFKLFETINNRGLRLSPTDIVKNFLLGNAARFGKDSLNEARKSWSKLLNCLDGTNIDAFFRYYLMSRLKVRVKKIARLSLEAHMVGFSLARNCNLGAQSLHKASVGIGRAGHASS